MTTVDEEALISTLERVGPDRHELFDAEEEAVLAELGALPVLGGDPRRDFLYESLRERVSRKELRYHSYVETLAGTGLAQVLNDAYLPADYPGDPDRRYKLEWAPPPVPAFSGVKIASKQTGKLYVISGFLGQGGQASAASVAAIGIIIKPTHKVSRLTIKPTVSYRWAHIADVAPALHEPNFVRSAGYLSLDLSQIHPVASDSDAYPGDYIQLWHEETPSGAGYGWQRGGGNFNSTLQIVARRGDLLALWVVVRVDLLKVDKNPDWLSKGQAYIQADVPMIWVHETAVI